MLLKGKLNFAHFVSQRPPISAELVLITSASGHVGYAVLLEALSQGYQVRAAVRTQTKANLIRQTISQPGKLEFVIVLDITKDSAYDAALQDVDAVIHVACPVPGEGYKDFEREIVHPAVQGTTGILHSALRTASVRKVVITSSNGAIMDMQNLDKPVNADTVVPIDFGPYESVFHVYISAKAQALAKTKELVATQHPQFSVATVVPGYVIGRNVLAHTANEVLAGSNGLALGPTLSRENKQGLPFSVAHLSDVAKVHVAALGRNGNFGVNYSNADACWDDANDVAKRFFGTAVESGLLPANGTTKKIKFDFDATETEREFGMKFKNFEDMMSDIIEYYVEVSRPTE